MEFDNSDMLYRPRAAPANILTVGITFTVYTVSAALSVWIDLNVERKSSPGHNPV